MRELSTAAERVPRRGYVFLFLLTGDSGRRVVSF